jgi:hypothetical protein
MGAAVRLQVVEVRLLHDAGTVGEVHADKDRAKDNLLIRGDAPNALTSLIVTCPPQTGPPMMRVLRSPRANLSPGPNRGARHTLKQMYAETTLAQRQGVGCTLVQGEYFQRRAERAQRQYLRAIKTLATVRRLLTPAIQVNVADKQIVVGG